MAKNSSLSQRTDGASVGIPDASSFNQRGVYNSQGYNTFQHSRSHFTTERFAEIKPFLFQDVKSADVVRLSNSCTTQSLAASNPFLSKVYKQMGIFQVPYSAIMPKTWDYLSVRPSYGDDVPQDAYCGFNVYNLLQAYLSSLTNYPVTDPDKKIYYVYRVCSFLAVFGDDSLLRNSGVYFPFSTQPVYDLLVDFVRDYGLFAFRGTEIMKYSYARDIAYKLINGNIEFNAANFNPAGLTDFMTEVASVISHFEGVAWVNTTFGSKPVSLDRIVAYQLVCAQYFSNDKIDFVHSAKEYMDNMHSIFVNLYSSAAATTFLYNGDRLEYDVFSQHYLRYITDGIRSVSTEVEYFDAFLINLFGYRTSLKFGDYFSSSRKLPLAPGDVTAEVASGKVSAIDVNKALWMQRFLNSVNRASSDVYKYLKEMFGAEPANKIPMPYELITETSLVGTTQTANTADSTGDIVSRFVSGSSARIYDAFIDIPSVLVGVSSYFAQDVPYSSASDRILFDVTREQKFNTFMQHIGDQEVLLSELGYFDSAQNTNFGYQTRFAEYKFSLPTVTGAFLGSLKNWLLKDNFPAIMQKNLNKYNEYKLDSEFIRNQNTVFDDVLPVMTSTGSEYFHFICKYDINLLINSRMQKTDDIL